MDETRGQRIKRLRIARGLTLERFASLTGVTYAAAWKWENEPQKEVDMRGENWGNVCRVLLTDMPYLLWGEDRAPKTAPKLSASSRRRGSHTP